MGNNILGGCQVLDLTDEKCTLCAKLLSDMGAEIIRVDRPGQAPLPDFTYTRKHSLNIETKKGADLFKRLVKDSSIVIESFRPGFLRTRGIDYSALKQINPRLIMVSITPFGQTGPYKDFTSSELVSSAMGGQIYVCGDPDKPPLKPFGPQLYSAACLFAANGILLALWQSRSSNKGQYIDISMHECAASTLDHVLVRYFYEGVVAERQGSLYWNKTFRIFPCRDGYIQLSLFHQWETLVEWLDSEGMAADLKDKTWLDRSARLRNIEHIIEILEKWTRSHSVDELVEQGQLMHFPWARVDSIPQVIGNSQLNERGFFTEITDRASGRKYKYPAALI